MHSAVRMQSQSKNPSSKKMEICFSYLDSLPLEGPSKVLHGITLHRTAKLFVHAGDGWADAGGGERAQGSERNDPKSRLAILLFIPDLAF